MLVVLLLLIVLLTSSDAFRLKKFIAGVALSASLIHPVLVHADSAADDAYAKQVCDAILKDGPDAVKDRTVSCSVPSRPRVVLPKGDGMIPPSINTHLTPYHTLYTDFENKDSTGNPMSDIVKLIPSLKYYNIIANEYSSRSTDFKGESNGFAPLL